MIYFAATTMAQAPAIQWAKCFGGSSTDVATCIQQTNDTGYIIAGYSKSNDSDVSGNHGGIDYWVVKLDITGNIQWQKSLGGMGDDEAFSIQQTTDGGFFVAGYSGSIDGDVTGHHGSFFVSDYWVVKLNATGIIQWQKSLGGTADDVAQSIQQTNDGGYIVAGVTGSKNGDVTGKHGLDSITTDYWVVKLNGTGIIQWQKSLGGTADDVAQSIQQTNDGGFIVAGYSGSIDGDVTGNHVDSDYWVVKLNATGIIQWQKSLGGISADKATSIEQTTDGGYILAGGSMSNNGDVSGHHGNSFNDYWVLKINTNGTLLWQNSFGGYYEDLANFIRQTIDGGYIIAGYSQSYDGDVTGHRGSSSYSDFWIVKLAGTTGIEEIPTSSITLSPNPTTGIITIKGITQPTVAVYNLMGQKVVVAQGCNEVNLAQLPAGMYLVQVFNKDMQLVKSEKVILNR